MIHWNFQLNQFSHLKKSLKNLTPLIFLGFLWLSPWKKHTESPLCLHCNAPETIEHYLLFCRRYTTNRGKLITSLTKLGVPINLQNLLGGGEFPSHLQINITAALEVYLRESGQLYGLSQEWPYHQEGPMINTKHPYLPPEEAMK